MPTKREIRRATAILGSIKTPKKAAASRRNGLLGGRPRKLPVLPSPARPEPTQHPAPPGVSLDDVRAILGPPTGVLSARALGVPDHEEENT